MEIDKFKIFEDFNDNKQKNGSKHDESYIDRNLSNSDIHKYYSYDINLNIGDSNSIEQ